MSFWRAVMVILTKDLRVELRTREIVATMGLFALLVVVIFAFAFAVDLQSGDSSMARVKTAASGASLVGPGILWVTLLFAGTIGLTRLFDREREFGCLAGLLRCPAGPRAVYVAKCLSLFVFMIITEILVVPLTLAFLGLEIPTEGLPLLVLALVLGTVGFALVGTLFGAMLASVRMREVLIPVVVYPMVVPVLIGGVELTHVALGAGDPADVAGWLRLMIGFNVIFAVAPMWVFEQVMVD